MNEQVEASTQAMPPRIGPVATGPSAPANSESAYPLDKTIQIMFGVRPVRGGFIVESVVVEPSGEGDKPNRRSDMEVIAGGLNQATERRINRCIRSEVESSMTRSFVALSALQG